MVTRQDLIERMAKARYEAYTGCWENASEASKEFTMRETVVMLEVVLSSIEEAVKPLRGCFRTYGKSTFNGLSDADKIRCMRQAIDQTLKAVDELKEEK